MPFSFSFMDFLLKVFRICDAMIPMLNYLVENEQRCLGFVSEIPFSLLANMSNLNPQRILLFRVQYM